MTLTDDNTHVLRRFEKFSGVRVVILEGRGSEENMWREVTYWFDENGVQVARDDPAERTQQR